MGSRYKKVLTTLLVLMTTPGCTAHFHQPSLYWQDVAVTTSARVRKISVNYASGELIELASYTAALTSAAVHNQDIYLLSSATDTITRLAIGKEADASFEQRQSISLPDNPTQAVITPDGKWLFACTNTAGEIVRFPLSDGLINGAATPLSTGHVPCWKFAVSPDSRRIAILDSVPAQLTVYDLDSSSGALTVYASTTNAAFMQDIVFDATGDRIYGAGYNAGVVLTYLIQEGALTLLNQVSSAAQPNFLALSEDGSLLFVSHKSGQTLSVFAVSSSGLASSPLHTLNLAGSGAALFLSRSDRYAVIGVGNTLRLARWDRATGFTFLDPTLALSAAAINLFGLRRSISIAQ
ncbi:MAG: beta-propeller fold lactonase family protein [Bacteriovoracia bacterium]